MPVRAKEAVKKDKEFQDNLLLLENLIFTRNYRQSNLTSRTQINQQLMFF